jgi:hypothetical protein
MAAGKYALLIEQGATLDLQLEYKDSANVPIDVSLYTGVLQIRPDYADNTATVYITLESPSVDGTGIDFGNEDGMIYIKMSDTTTTALTFDTAVYDFEITDTDTGKVTRLLQGTVKLSKEVTRP